VTFFLRKAGFCRAADGCSCRAAAAGLQGCSCSAAAALQGGSWPGPDIIDFQLNYHSKLIISGLQLARPRYH
tara:strand:+ start:169 stop:384 length:216 start_codon:yes stop_codon:yes gene_type:complete